MNKVYANLIVFEHFEAIKINAKSDKYALDIISTLPNTVNTAKLKEKSLLLTALTVIEPLVRCGEEIQLCLPFDIDGYTFEAIENNQNTLDAKICTFLSLPWMKNGLTVCQEKHHTDDMCTAFFSNRNTIEIYDKDLSLKYTTEILKSLPFAIYERLRAECDYAWTCLECPKGQSGECEAIIYEQHLQYL